MIVVMKKGASAIQIDHMVQRVEGLGLKAHVLVGTERTVIAAIGDKRDQDRESLESGPGVAEVVIGRLAESLAGGWSEPGAAAAIEFDAASRSLLVLDSHRVQRRIDRLLADWQASQTGGRSASKP